MHAYQIWSVCTPVAKFRQILVDVVSGPKSD